jgi:hypothetical protein
LLFDWRNSRAPEAIITDWAAGSASSLIFGRLSATLRSISWSLNPDTFTTSGSHIIHTAKQQLADRNDRAEGFVQGTTNLYSVTCAGFTLHPPAFALIIGFVV